MGLINKAKGAVASAASGAKKATLDALRKMAGEIASEDSDDARKARKVLDALDESSDAEGDDDDDKHREPDGDEDGAEGDDGDDASAAEGDDGDDASAAEGDDDDGDDGDDASAAEGDDDGDDASAAARASGTYSRTKALAKSNVEAAAVADQRRKSCLASAEKCERKARAILRSGAKDAAKRGNALLIEADRHRGEATGHARDAKQYRNLATMYENQLDVLRSVRTTGRASVPATKSPKGAKAALAGRRAAGTQAPQSAATATGHRITTPGMAAAMGLEGSEAPAFDRDAGGNLMISIPTQAQLAAGLEDMTNKVTKLGGRANGR